MNRACACSGVYIHLLLHFPTTEATSNFIPTKLIFYHAVLQSSNSHSAIFYSKFSFYPADLGHHFILCKGGGTGSEEGKKCMG